MDKHYLFKFSKPIPPIEFEDALAQIGIPSEAVSYTSPEASERLFAIQNRCLPARPLPGERTVTDLGNGMVRIELQPRATNETLSVLLQGDFAPGLNLEATARHGVSASVRVRELKEDGTPKRAKKKTKTS